MSVRVVLADDQALFREGLCTLLNAQPDVEVVGEAGNGEEAVELATTLHPDVILMDIRMPVLDGVAATRRVRDAHVAGSCRVIILTTFDDDEYVFDGLRAGAVGYLLKDVPSTKLLEAIHAAARGESFLQASITAKVVAEFARLADATPPPRLVQDGPLSKRDLSILRLVASGASNREIAASLHLAEGTVKNRVTTIMTRLTARDRGHAVVLAKDRGLI